MASATVWLKELGMPPREVCLDWAWQIHLQTRGPTKGRAPALESLTWDHIEVMSVGRIGLDESKLAYSPDALLRELWLWSDGDVDAQVARGAEIAKLSAQELFSEIRLATLNDYSSPIAPMDVAELESDWELPVVKRNSPSSKSALHPRGSQLSKVIVLAKQHGLALSLVAGALFSGLAWSIVTLGKKEVKATPQRGVAAKHDASTNTEPLTTTEDRAASEFSLSDLESNVPLIELPTFGDLAGLDQDAPPLVSPLKAVSDLAGTLGENVVTENASALEPRTSALRNSASAFEPGAKEPLEPDPVMVDDVSRLKSDGDVMAEIAAMAKSAEANPSESELAAVSAPNANAKFEPLVIATNPMIQTQKIPIRGGVRVKQPVWYMQLSVDDEFEVVPKERQRIAERQATTWYITDADAKSPRTWIMIQVQASPGRQSSLRWRVGAGAEDLPSLILPLGKEMLQTWQLRLRAQSQFAQQESDRLKQLAKETTREMRTSLSSQSKALEQQSKLASRVSAIAGESLWLDDLLRSQVTVCAELRDGHEADSTLIWQFGDPENPINKVSSDLPEDMPSDAAPALNSVK